MPRYTVTDPQSGKTVVLTGDSPPTEAELTEIFATINKSAAPTATPAEPSSGGDRLSSALAALRGFLPAIGGMAGGVAGGPIGAAVGGAAGEGYRQLADHATELPGAVADVARNLVTQPGATLRGLVGGAGSGAMAAGTEGAIQGAIEGGGQLAAKYVVQPAARALMRGYLKPSLAGANIAKAREIVQTALDEALPVTQGGEARAERLISELNRDINSQLAKVKGKVDLGQVADRVRRFAKAKYFKPGVDDADYRAALAVADSIDSHAALKLPNGAQVTRVNATAANDIKQAVRPPSRAFGQQSYVPETATRKVAGSVMREQIERTAAKEGVSDVAAMNAREGRLIDAQDAIKRAAGREENKGLNPTAVPNLIAGSVGLEESYRKDPAAGLAWTLATRAALSPAVATRAAIWAAKLARNGYSVSNAARMAVAAVRSQTQQEGDRDPNRP